MRWLQPAEGDRGSNADETSVVFETVGGVGLSLETPLARPSALGSDGEAGGGSLDALPTVMLSARDARLVALHWPISNRYQVYELPSPGEGGGADGLTQVCDGTCESLAWLLMDTGGEWEEVLAVLEVDAREHLAGKSFAEAMAR